MIGVVTAFVLLAGALCLMIGAIVHNQIDPTYSTALTISIANVVSLIVAVVGMLISMVVYRKNKKANWAKRTMLFGIVCVVMLALLFPLSGMGYLSKVR